MEIRLQFPAQRVMDFSRLLRRIELETTALLLLIPCMLPYFLSTLWNLGWTLLWEGFSLGAQAGFILFTIGSIYLLLLKVIHWRGGLVRNALFDAHVVPGEDGVKCTLLDVTLSIVFQTGLWIPSAIWNPLMEVLDLMDMNWYNRSRRPTKVFPISSTASVPKLTEEVNTPALPTPISNPMVTTTPLPEPVTWVVGSADTVKIEGEFRPRQSANTPGKRVTFSDVVTNIEIPKKGRARSTRARKAAPKKNLSAEFH